MKYKHNFHRIGRLAQAKPEMRDAYTQSTFGPSTKYHDSPANPALSIIDKNPLQKMDEKSVFNTEIKRDLFKHRERAAH